MPGAVLPVAITFSFFHFPLRIVWRPDTHHFILPWFHYTIPPPESRSHTNTWKWLTVHGFVAMVTVSGEHFTLHTPNWLKATRFYIGRIVFDAIQWKLNTRAFNHARCYGPSIAPTTENTVICGNINLPPPDRPTTAFDSYQISALSTGKSPKSICSGPSLALYLLAIQV